MAEPKDILVLVNTPGFEPDYEVYHHLALYERCVENFDERPISTHQLVGDRCMNCHTYAGQSAQRSMMYVRGEGGGAILNDAGTLSKLDIKAPGMVSGSVYFGFSPSGRYITFSTKVIIPAAAGGVRRQKRRLCGRPENPAHHLIAPAGR